MDRRTITLPWPNAKLTPHAKGNWHEKARATKEARNLAWAVAMEAPRVERNPKAEILVEYWPKDFRSDCQNAHGRMKAYIDGIADAMGCDDRHFRVDFPRVFAGRDPAGKGKVLFHILRGRS